MEENEFKSYAAVTRRDRAVESAEWMRELLERSGTGVLATAVPSQEDGAPQPFLSTLLFVFDAERNAIYLHTARRGRVWENLQVNARVCFTASEMGRLLPAAQALNFSVEYASVVVFGRAVAVEDAQEAEHALQMMLDRYFPHLHSAVDYRPITTGERERTAVYRLEIESWSGKQKTVAPDFPGAFDYPHAPQGE